MIRVNKWVTLMMTTLVVVLILSCNVSPGFNATPEISFISIDKDTMEQGSFLLDSIILTIAFKDGNGDLGGEGTVLNDDIVLIDSRTGERFLGFNIPALPVSGARGGIEGNMKLKVYADCCLYFYPNAPNPCEASVLQPYDTFTLDITLQDNAGNMSNTVTSSPITLICN